MPFEFSPELASQLVEDGPMQSLPLVGVSLLLPYLEPYLIRTMSEAKDHITDPQLVEELKRFSAQEGQHFRMHMKLNEAMGTKRFPRLPEFEKELSDDYRRFTNTKSLRFNLAYAEGFEAFTMNASLFSFEYSLGPEADSPVGQMLEWHLIEELEHRTVAFDVYQHVCGDYFYRVFASLYAQWHFIRWVIRVSRYMSSESPKATRSPEEVAELKKQGSKQGWLALRILLPRLLRTYLPGYTPHAVPFTPAMQKVADKYSKLATSTS
jgi:predicted metal-dependent hydrolase